MKCPAKAAIKKLDKFKKAWGDDNLIDEQITFKGVPTFGERDLCTLQLMGKGAFSDVFKAFDKKNTDTMLAIKRLQPHVQNNPKILATCVADQALETAILTNLNHKNIIALRGVKEGNTIDHLKNGTFFFALDPLGGTLEDRFATWKNERSKQRIRRSFESSDTVKKRLENIALSIAKGMEYMHSKRILYRDMKPANIGFDEQTGQVKIFDFGLSRVLAEEEVSNPRNLTLRVGTPRYMAPEIAREEDNYCFPVDVYSFSIIVWQMVTNQLPFEEISCYNDLKEEVGNNKLRPNLKYIKSDALKALLEISWSNNPDIRPTFSSVRKSLENIIKGDDSNYGKKSRRSSFGRSSRSMASTISSTEEPRRRATRRYSAPSNINPTLPPREVSVIETKKLEPSRRRRSGYRKSDLVDNIPKELIETAKTRKCFRKLFRKNKSNDSLSLTADQDLQSTNNDDMSIATPLETSMERHESAPMVPMETMFKRQVSSDRSAPKSPPQVTMTNMRRQGSVPMAPPQIALTSMRRQGSIPLYLTKSSMGKESSTPPSRTRYGKTTQLSPRQTNNVRRRKSLISPKDFSEDKDSPPKVATSPISNRVLYNMRQKPTYPSLQPTRIGRRQKSLISEEDARGHEQYNCLNNQDGAVRTRRFGQRLLAPHQIEKESGHCLAPPPEMEYRSSAPIIQMPKLTSKNINNRLKGGFFVRKVDDLDYNTAPLSAEEMSV